MDTKRNRTPFTFKKKAFLGFSFIVLSAFFYLNVKMIADPVTERINIPGITMVADTEAVPPAQEQPVDSLTSELPSIKKMIPEINQVVKLPRFEIGPF